MWWMEPNAVVYWEGEHSEQYTWLDVLQQRAIMQAANRPNDVFGMDNNVTNLLKGISKNIWSLGVFCDWA